VSKRFLSRFSQQRPPQSGASLYTSGPEPQRIFEPASADSIDNQINIANSSSRPPTPLSVSVAPKNSLIATATRACRAPPSISDSRSKTPRGWEAATTTLGGLSTPEYPSHRTRPSRVDQPEDRHTSFNASDIDQRAHQSVDWLTEGASTYTFWQPGYVKFEADLYLTLQTDGITEWLHKFSPRHHHNTHIITCLMDQKC
jgi:hypothetical protein